MLAGGTGAAAAGAAPVALDLPDGIGVCERRLIRAARLRRQARKELVDQPQEAVGLLRDVQRERRRVSVVGGHVVLLRLEGG